MVARVRLPASALILGLLASCTGAIGEANGNSGKLLTTLVTAAGGRSNGGAYTSFANAGSVLSPIVA